MSELIESMILEARPRLQSCSIFIIPRNGLKINLSSLKISLKPNSILFLYKNSNDTKQICETIELNKICFLPKTLSNLIVEDRYISFRVATTTLTNRGSFKTEVLHLKPFTGKLLNVDVSKKYEILKNNCTLHCRNCTNNLSADIAFERILPLPSENCNPSDWFCHKPNNSLNMCLEPNVNDLFYGVSNFKIHLSVLNKNSVHIDRVIFCKRCLAWLGTKNTNSCFLWDCTTRFQFELENLNFENDFSNLKINENINLKSLKESILNTIDQTVSFVCKILIECNVTAEKSEYLLLWILDRNLNVSLFENSQEIGSKLTTGRLNIIKLNNCSAIKLLFRCIRTQDDDIVTRWQSDIHVQNLTVALPMLQTAVKYLNKNAEFMSKYSQADEGFTISYIILN